MHENEPDRVQPVQVLTTLRGGPHDGSQIAVAVEAGQAPDVVGFVGVRGGVPGYHLYVTNGGDVGVWIGFGACGMRDPERPSKPRRSIPVKARGKH